MAVRTTTAVAALILGTQAPLIHADSLEQRVATLEQKTQDQATQLKHQQEVIEQQRAILEGSPSRLKDVEEDMESDKGHLLSWEDGWFRKIEIGGLIEVEANYSDPFDGKHESDLTLATFELDIAAQVNDWVRVDAALLFEEDDTDPPELDVGYITFANPDVTPFFLSVGLLYVPVAAFETNMISDPLTLEIGETQESAVQVGFEYQGFSGSIYAFNGQLEVDGENQIEDWGANLGYSQENDQISWAIGVGYINNLGDSDTLQDTIAVDPTSRTGGWSASANAQIGPVDIIGEYLSATDDFDSTVLDFNGSGARPSAWNIELGYSFSLFGKDSIVSVAYQGTREALALDLPERRWMLGWSIDIFENTAFSLEYDYDTDYDESDGGTGENANTVVAQISVEF